jgi:hypothetical protein
MVKKVLKNPALFTRTGWERPKISISLMLPNKGYGNA